MAVASCMNDATDLKWLGGILYYMNMNWRQAYAAAAGREENMLVMARTVVFKKISSTNMIESAGRYPPPRST